MPLEFKCSIEDFIKAGKISQEDLKEMKQWVESNDKLPKIPDEILAMMLISCDRDQQLARKTVILYFESKNSATEMFDNRDIDSMELQNTLAVIKILTLPSKTEKNASIVFTRLEDPSYFKYDTLSQMKIVCMLVDTLMAKKDPPERLMALVDIEKFEFKLLPRLSLRAMNQFFHYTQEGLPFKIESIHVINCSAVIKPILKILQFCMKSEIINKFVIHYKGYDREDFFKHHISAKCIPSDYGGELPSVEELQKQSIAELREMKSFFDEEEEMRRKYKHNCL